MDAPEEDLDIKLQRVSGELIAAFDKRLESFLWKADGSGGSRVRSRVRARETFHLMSDVSENLHPPSDLLPFGDIFWPRANETAWTA